ncbi:hypothetical protein L7F22_066735 [Adiantum nelumboides]|nr:hypothetical protein [Adiantum nelumboides]
MPCLFTPSIAAKHEELFNNRGVKFNEDVIVKATVSKYGQKVSAVELSDEAILDANTVVVGIGATPVVGPFLESNLCMAERGIEVDGQNKLLSKYLGHWLVVDNFLFVWWSKLENGTLTAVANMEQVQKLSGLESFSYSILQRIDQNGVVEEDKANQQAKLRVVAYVEDCARIIMFS